MMGVSRVMGKMKLWLYINGESTGKEWPLITPTTARRSSKTSLLLVAFLVPGNHAQRASIEIKIYRGIFSYTLDKNHTLVQSSSNLSRHRLIHGRRRYKKRRYECDHVGCSRWFRKLKTLQDHQQKPHKQGKTPNHTDNCSPDSYDGEPPAIPQHSSMTSSPHELDYIDLCSQDESLNWLLYFADLPVQSQGCHMSQHEDNRQGIPTSVPGDDGISKHGEQTHTQLVLQEEAVTQQTYEVSGTGHPGVAMMTNAVLPQCQLSQEVQRLSIDPQCLASGTATPVPNPWIPDGIYTHEFSFQTENMSSIPVVSGPQHTQ
ncbi:hypothetical protein HZS61_007384 [Fusarium oxysporum f. sp. conglutinans]|uniref:C2H2-type domain-containing protein n=1 Tax=Fusarium oxysporum f. sp. conglutinans TaxID=100902 RepID=A0A8H6G8X3_FUSOX|nr:hypothetical protein HZS61_007384 [Fusarium oxysporum f. sp. conglutinans]